MCARTNRVQQEGNTTLCTTTISTGISTGTVEGAVHLQQEHFSMLQLAIEAA
jgi:hypothetical protein